MREFWNKFFHKLKICIAICCHGTSQLDFSSIFLVLKNSHENQYISMEFVDLLNKRKICWSTHTYLNLWYYHTYTCFTCSRFSMFSMNRFEYQVFLCFKSYFWIWLCILYLANISKVGKLLCFYQVYKRLVFTKRKIQKSINKFCRDFCIFQINQREKKWYFLILLFFLFFLQHLLSTCHNDNGLTNKKKKILSFLFGIYCCCLFLPLNVKRIALNKHLNGKMMLKWRKWEKSRNIITMLSFVLVIVCIIR